MLSSGPALCVDPHYAKKNFSSARKCHSTYVLRSDNVNKQSINRRLTLLTFCHIYFPKRDVLEGVTATVWSSLEFEREILEFYSYIRYLRHERRGGGYRNVGTFYYPCTVECVYLWVLCIDVIDSRLEHRATRGSLAWLVLFSSHPTVITRRHTPPSADTRSHIPLFFPCLFCRTTKNNRSQIENHTV